MLYRKHRPQSWSDITAQEHVVKTLKQELISGTIAHAFLLCGPRGVGKTTTARLLAKSLNCKNPTKAEPCNTCENCDNITKSQSIDVIEIDAASHTGVDNVRENIIENARFTPTQSAYKVFIIDEVHMLSTSAFNALLKTIEEPPAHAIFIMATTELHKIPATILSRCQRFDFKHISHSDITTRLQNLAKKENIAIEEEILHHVAWRAQGSMRDAESLLSQIFAVAQDSTITVEIANTVLPARNSADMIAYLQSALTGNVAEALSTVQTLCETGAHVAHVMDDAIDILRTMLLVKTSQSFGDSYFNTHDRDALTHISEQTDIERILNALDILMKRRADIGLSPILHLPLELAAIDIALEAGLIIENRENPSPKQKKQPAEPPEPESPQPPQSKEEPMTPVPAEATKKNETVKPPDTNQPSADMQPTSPPDVIATKAEINPTNDEKPATTNLTISDITAKWQQFLQHLHQFNHSLPFVLKTCTPSGLTGSELTVTLPYEFHQKKLEEPAAKHNIQTALKDIYQTELTIRAKVIATGNDESQEVVAKVLETFGGTVVSE